MSFPDSCKVYVGDLGDEADKRELESAFEYYGHLRSVWVAKKPAGFAFIHFEYPRDAEDAVRNLDGTKICGRRVKVEMSSGRQRDRGGRYRGDRCYNCDRYGHRASECLDYRGSGRRPIGGAGGGRRRSRSRNRDYRRRSRSSDRSRSRSYSKERRRNDRSDSGSDRSYSRSP